MTRRIDWSSALAWTETKSVAYPSVGLSAILTELLPIKNNVLTSLKLRGSYSEVGNYNPAGRLPVTVLRSVGQIPIYYNKKAPQNHDYVELSASPLYPFGYGLSYTTFEYSDLCVSAMPPHSFEVSFKVKNTGKYDGEEVSQLYLRDEYASVVQPLKQLKHFEHFYLKRGEVKEVKFILPESDLALVDRDLRTVVEPGFR